jgi:uncharacterized protein YgiM (DUF1202 family)
MKRTLVRVIVLVLALVGAPWASFSALAQGDPQVDPNANISWPPPVYVLRGEVDIRGSANLPNMRNYFISFRPLNDDLTPADSEFLPAILPTTRPVQEGILGTWDTTTTDDGLYELRLTVNVRGGQPVVHTVAPLRVENNPPPFVEVETTPTATPTFVPPPQPTTAVPTVDLTPRGTVRGNSANVRTGDSTDFSIITALTQGQQVMLIGVSNRGTGWYQVRLPDGRIGWMAPSVLDVSGNLGILPFVSPPPPPPTRTPIPATLTPTPGSAANLVAGVVVFDPGTPTCAQTFVVGFDVANLGTQQTLASGTIALVDTRAADGSVQGTTVGGFPVLLPGQTFRVTMPLTISTWYNETHRITLTIDSGNAIPEATKADNMRVVEYVLQKGACP